jgi:PPOX class probable F420-dependent enzyme
MPRADRLSQQGIELLQENHIAILSTVLPNGSPHATPVWVDVEPDGTHVLVNIPEGHVKLKNINRDPRVAVTVVDSANHFRTVQVRGTVDDQRGPEQGSNEHIDTLSKKYTGRGYTFREGEKRIIVRIKVTHVLGWSATGGAWRERQGENVTERFQARGS